MQLFCPLRVGNSQLLEMINLVSTPEIWLLKREILCGSGVQMDVEAVIAVKKTRLFRTFFSPQTLFAAKHGGALVKIGTHRTAFRVTELARYQESKTRREGRVRSGPDWLDRQRNSRKLSRVCTIANSIATPSAKWRTTRPRILLRKTGVPTVGRTSQSTAAPDSERSTRRQG